MRFWNSRLPIFDCHKKSEVGLASNKMTFRHEPGSGLRVARVMAIDAFRQQAFATALTASRKRGASTFGPHPRAKTVLTLACPLGWLISAFHKTENSRPRELRAVTLRMSRGLSIGAGAALF